MSSNRNRKHVANRSVPLNKRLQYKWHDFKDEWFRDRDGNVVFGQVPNIPLVVFFITGVFAVISFHGFWHGLSQLVAVISIFFWAWLEIRSGVTRMRRLMGKVAVAATIVVIILYLMP